METKMVCTSSVQKVDAKNPSDRPQNPINSDKIIPQ